MGEISFDCPHPECRTKSSAFSTNSYALVSQSLLAMFAQCKNCNETVIFRLARKTPNANPTNISGKEFYSHFHLIDVDPKPPEIGTVEYLPDRVSKAYLEAEGCYTDGRMNSAAAMYRRTIERTLRQIDPDQTGSLYHRIEALKDASALPQTLIDLLHRIRFLGNTAVHDDEDVDPADVTHGREFVHLFLVYTFELPEKIRQATEQTA